MKFSTLIVFLFALFASFQAKAVSMTGADTVFTIESDPNGTADIKFSFLADSSFTLYMYFFAQPQEDAENDTTLNSSGYWGFEGNQIKLTFTKNVPLLEAIFDESYTEEKEFEVLDETTVLLNAKLEEYHIWGVSCKKEFR